ncbi:MAG TPA: Melibiase subfamily, partial [Opitutus sp.]|nr:Melibiase subfamily [Opitutus sp.]
ESNGRGREPGPTRFMVVVATNENEAKTAGVPVAVRLADLGFSGPVRVRDLWTHRDVGEISGEFAPEIAFHGAGLFRLSPAR